jgi:peroxiredoxin
MPPTPSNDIPLGTRAPSFALPDASGAMRSLEEFGDAKAVLVAFISNRCPFVLHIRDAFAVFAAEYARKGLQVIAINSNDEAAYPEEGQARLAEEAARYGNAFPYLKDGAQTVARAYTAACTPDFFLFDRDRKLFYHGQFDDSRPKNGLPVTGADLRRAVDLALAGEAAPSEQKFAIGCNIKWTVGNEPSWFQSPPAKSAAA